jgi:archaetidylinositol phosphate synthase
VVLNRYRKTADGFLVPMARPLLGVNPNHISAVALALAAISGVIFYLSTDWGLLLLLASVVVAVSSLLDALDGKVAKMSGRAGLRGDFLDHVADRYADVFILVGVIASAYCGWLIGILGLTGVFMTSYLGTQAQAVGVRRDYGGILGRADRLALLIVVPVIQYLVIHFWTDPVVLTVPLPWMDIPLTPMEMMMLWFGLAGHFTAVQRAFRTWRALSRRR